MPEPSASFPAIYQLRVVLRGVSQLVWRQLLVHKPLTGGFRTAVAIRGEGLLTTASDERSGKPAHSRRLARAPARAPCFSNPAPPRGPLGSITPQSKVLEPLRQSVSGSPERSIAVWEAREKNFRGVGRVRYDPADPQKWKPDNQGKALKSLEAALPARRRSSRRRKSMPHRRLVLF